MGRSKLSKRDAFPQAVKQWRSFLLSVPWCSSKSSKSERCMWMTTADVALLSQLRMDPWKDRVEFNEGTSSLKFKSCERLFLW